MPQPDYNLQPTSGLLIGLDPDYRLKEAQVDAVGAFKNGIPTDASGNPDYSAMVKTLFSKGAYEPAAKLLDASLTQRQLDAASKMSGGLSQWLSPTSTAQPSSTSAGQPAAPSSYTKPVPGFDSANERTLGFEGALNPKDTNGTPSNYGINQAAHPDIDVTKLTKDQASAIYRKQYWDAIGADNMSPSLSRAAYDTAVIAGPGKAKELLAASGGDPMKFMDLREQFQKSLLDSDPQKYGPYASAWAARNNGLRYDILALNAQNGQGAPTSAPSGDAPAPSPAAPAPVRVAQAGATDAPAAEGQHPYGGTPSPTAGPQQPTQSAPPATAPADPVSPASPAMTPVPVAAAGRPAPVPTAVATPPPLSPNAGALPAPSDPSYGGQVPDAWLKAGHSAADWVRYARSMAMIGSGNPYAKGMSDQWSKIADNLETSILKQNELTNEQKNARDPTAVAYEHQRDDYKYQSRVNAQNSTAAIEGAAARKEAETEAMGLGKLPEQYAAAADGARSQNSMIDQMLDASRQFQMGKFADKEQLFNSTVSALGHKLGIDTSSIDGKTAAYEDFGKLAGQFSRQAMKEAGGRAGGIQELRFITNTLPAPTMSQAGFEAVGNQLKGQNDFAIAKQRAGDAWLNSHGTMRGFDTDWNSNVTPAAFVMHRLQVEQPDVFSQTVTRLAQSAQGRAVLKSVRSGLTFADRNSLLD